MLFLDPYRIVGVLPTFFTTTPPNCTPKLLEGIGLRLAVQDKNSS